MRNFVLAFTLLAFTLSAQESKTTSRRGEVAGYTSRDATVFSVMGWGVLLAAGIAAICILIPNSSSSSGGHTH